MITIRDGGPADAGTAIALLDEAVAWLVARGQTGQWGTEPFSTFPARLAAADEWAASGGLRIAETADGEPVGALVLGVHPAWVEPPAVPENYLTLVVTSRRFAGQDLGGQLVRHAIAETRAAGLPQLRVDCWAGAPDLVAWYERQGFERSGTFTVKGTWHGEVLSMDLS